MPDDLHLARMASTRRPILSDNIALCSTPVVDMLLVLARNDRSNAGPDCHPHQTIFTPP